MVIHVSEAQRRTAVSDCCCCHVTTNHPSHDCTHIDDHDLATYDVTFMFKQVAVLSNNLIEWVLISYSKSTVRDLRMPI